MIFEDMLSVAIGLENGITRIRLSKSFIIAGLIGQDSEENHIDNPR